MIFTATEDTEDDDDESVRLTFGTLPTYVTRGGTATTTVSITDDDVPEVRVSFRRSSYTVDEGAPTTITVTLSADPERSVTIPIVGAGRDGATASDFSIAPSSVTFAAGERSKSLVFTATQDTEDDDGESVELGFGTLPAMVSNGTTITATVSITDDDHPEVGVSFGSGSYAVDEGATTTITVTLSADPERRS